tara:strand:+ start:385 stop:609 length:225 start_codon:yes stop_codon:yes gene_type:complete
MKKIKLTKGDLIVNKGTGKNFLLVSRYKNNGRYFWNTVSNDGVCNSFYEKNLRHKLIKESVNWQLMKSPRSSAG